MAFTSIPSPIHLFTHPSTNMLFWHHFKDFNYFAINFPPFLQAHLFLHIFSSLPQPIFQIIFNYLNYFVINFPTFLCKLTSFYTNSVRFLGQVLLRLYSFPQPQKHMQNRFLAALDNFNVLLFHKTVLLGVVNQFIHLALFLPLFTISSVTASHISHISHNQ